MINVLKLSTKYEVRKMRDSDAESILDLCSGNNLDVKEVGDTCTIWYNPKKPKDAQVFRGSDKYLKYLLLLGVVITLLGIILTFVGLAMAFK